uniref:Prolactin n=3 Tax=Nothobranchiidae TaxID=405002 RepID=A0A8C6MGX4_NOTFU
MEPGGEKRPQDDGKGTDRQQEGSEKWLWEEPAAAAFSSQVRNSFPSLNLDSAHQTRRCVEQSSDTDMHAPPLCSSPVHAGDVQSGAHQRPAGPSLPALRQAALSQHHAHPGHGRSQPTLALRGPSCRSPVVSAPSDSSWFMFRNIFFSSAGFHLMIILFCTQDSHFPPRVFMERPSMCHTSVLPTPNDKEQALLVPEPALMSLARSLLQAWAEPLSILSSNANTLPHPAKSSISSRIQELQEYSKSLGDGLDILSGKMGPDAQVISMLPYHGGTDLGQDRITKLTKFNFLLSCLRRDSHKIDSFLKVLRCRAAKMQPELC